MVEKYCIKKMMISVLFFTLLSSCGHDRFTLYILNTEQYVGCEILIDRVSYGIVTKDKANIRNYAISLKHGVRQIDVNCKAKNEFSKTVNVIDDGEHYVTLPIIQ